MSNTLITPSMLVEDYTAFMSRLVATVQDAEQLRLVQAWAELVYDVAHMAADAGLIAQDQSK